MIRGRSFGAAWAVVAAAWACGEDPARGLSVSAYGALALSADGNTMYAATADDGTIARIDLTDGRTASIRVGGEPTRLVRIDNRILATLRAERSVLELIDDGRTLVPGRTVEVGAEPVGITASRDGRFVYVAASVSDQVIELNSESLEPSRVWSFPHEPRWLVGTPDDGVLYVASAWRGLLSRIDLSSGVSRPVVLPQQRTSVDDERIQLSLRFTGDLDISPDGRTLALPVLSADNTTPIVEPPQPGDSADPRSAYGGRVRPQVALVSLEADGTPSMNGVRFADTVAEMGTGYLSSVRFSPDGRYVFAPAEGSATTLYFETAEPSATSSEPTTIEPSVGTLSVQAGPRSVAFKDDQVYVYNFLDRSVSQAPMPQGAPISVNSAVVARNISESMLSAQIERGRRLFYSSDNATVTFPGSGVSCASCHFEGRNDGLTWNFVRGPRQTLSLAGIVSARVPVRWSGDRASVEESVSLASRGLMGGSGISEEDARAVAAYVDYVRDIDPPQDSSDPVVAAGQAIFNRPDVGCAKCHSGAAFSDNRTYTMLGLDSVKTPTLRGIAATAPYFHDGSANSLREAIEVATRGLKETEAFGLTEEEYHALESFLRSL